MSLEAIVFDFDGLILDTEIVLYRIIDAIFREHGTALVYELWQSFIGHKDHPHWVDILQEQVGRPLDRDALVELRQGRYVAEVERLPVLEGVLDLIDAAAGAGVALAVASSSSASWVGPHLERIGIRHRFTAVCTGDEVDRGKPWPDVYRLALDRLGCAPACAVAIEDSPVGCDAASAAGMVAVAVPSEMTRGLAFPSARHVVSSAAELDLDVLASLLAEAPA
jgi:HAD superfamily hydrolase (TIGR01509 family)